MHGCDPLGVDHYVRQHREAHNDDQLDVAVNAELGEKLLVGRDVLRAAEGWCFFRSEVRQAQRED